MSADPLEIVRGDGRLLRTPAYTMDRRGRRPRSTLSSSARTLYRVLSRRGPQMLDDLSVPAGDSPWQVSDAMRELQALGLVHELNGRLVAVPFADAVDQLLQQQIGLLARALDDLLERQQRLRALLYEGQALGGAVGEAVQCTVLDGPEDVLLSPESNDPGRMRARQYLAVMQPGARFDEAVLDASLEQARAAVRQGIRLRAVHQISVLAHSRTVAYLSEMARLGVEVRLRGQLPFRLVLIDGRAAVCSVSGEAVGYETFMIHGGRVVSLLEQVFESTWVESAPLTGAMERTESAEGSSTHAVLTDQQQAIVRHLAEGQTDQAIARALGVTPRTVTRRLAEIYELLGVQSRFQAGATARRMGWI